MFNLNNKKLRSQQTLLVYTVTINPRSKPHLETEGFFLQTSASTIKAKKMKARYILE